MTTTTRARRSKKSKPQHKERTKSINDLINQVIRLKTEIKDRYFAEKDEEKRDVLRHRYWNDSKLRDIAIRYINIMLCSRAVADKFRISMATLLEQHLTYETIDPENLETIADIQMPVSFYMSNNKTK